MENNQGQEQSNIHPMIDGILKAHFPALDTEDKHPWTGQTEKNKRRNDDAETI